MRGPYQPASSKSSAAAMALVVVTVLLDAIVLGCSTTYAADVRRDMALGSGEVRRTNPGRPFCGNPGAHISSQLLIARLDSRWSSLGFQRGDRISTVNGEKIDSGAKYFEVMSRSRPGDRVVIEVVREGSVHSIAATCEDGLPAWNLVQSALDAGARGDWSTCLSDLARYEVADIRSSITQSFRLRCSEAARDSVGVLPDLSHAVIVYDAGRLAIEDAAFEADGLPVARGVVLAHVAWLQRFGYGSLATDLEGMLERATSGQAATAGDAQDESRSQVTQEHDYVGLGTCFAVGPDEVITSDHVVRGASGIAVRFTDGTVSTASIRARTPSTDIALLQIDETAPGTLAFSNRPAAVGDSVFTMGYPAPEVFGAEEKFVEGSVSARSGIGGDASQLQVALPIHPGNSGGPLIGPDGLVVGVIAAIPNTSAFYEAYAALPQNVAWVTKAEFAAPLIEERSKLPAITDRAAAIARTRRALCMVLAVGNPAR